MKNGQTKKFTVPARLQNKQKITDKEIIKIAEIGNKLHRHYFFLKTPSLLSIKIATFILFKPGR
jgi:phosphoenolpyruvate synthase/pyruvate phosphate dikinase